MPLRLGHVGRRHYADADLSLPRSDRRPVQAALRLQSRPAPGADTADALFASGRKLATDGDHKAALAKYAEAIAIDPKNVSYRSYKALSQLALGQPKEAQQ